MRIGFNGGVLGILLLSINNVFNNGTFVTYNFKYIHLITDALMRQSLKVEQPVPRFGRKQY